jgi:hypothetical protein
MFDKFPVEIDEIVLAADSVITVTVPFMVLVIPWPDAVVPLDLVIVEVRVRFVPLVVEELEVAVVTEADEADTLVDEVEFSAKEFEEVNWVEDSENGLVSVTPIVVNVTVRMVSFSVSWLDKSDPVGVLEGGRVELNHPVIVDTTVDPEDEEPVELEIGRTVPDSPSVKDRVDSVENVDGTVVRIVPFSVNELDERVPDDAVDDNVAFGRPVAVDTVEDPDAKEFPVELEEDIGPMVPDSSSVKDLVEGFDEPLDVADDVLRVEVTPVENE